MLIFCHQETLLFSISNLNFIEMCFGNEGSHEGVVVLGVADAQIFRPVDKLLDEVVENRLFDENSRSAKTDLAL